MNGVGHEALTPKHVKHLRKWLRWIVAHGADQPRGPEARSSADIFRGPDASGLHEDGYRSGNYGLLALNGGAQLACFPHNLRRIVEAYGILRNEPNEYEVMFSSRLPFSLLRPLNDGEGRVRALEVGIPSYWDVSRAVGMPEIAGCRAFVVGIPAEAMLWTKGASPVPGSSALYLTWCDVNAVLNWFGHTFAKPVEFLDLRATPRKRPRVASAVASDGVEGDRRADEAKLRGHLDERDVGAELVSCDMRNRTCRHLKCLPSASVPGLFVVPGFLSRDEHDDLLRFFTDPTTGVDWEPLARRDVTHYKRRFYYGLNRLSDVGEKVQKEPWFLEGMLARLRNRDRQCPIAEYPVPLDYECDQLTVNRYDYAGERGHSGIASHVDAHSALDDFILIVSLGSHTVMELKRFDQQSESIAPHPIFVAPRSLLILSGEARYSWTHGIAEKATDLLSEHEPPTPRGTRISLTWRKGRAGPHLASACMCPPLCDGEVGGVI